MENNILETNFAVPRTLNAMAAKFFVKTSKVMEQSGWYLKEGSQVTGVKMIASGEKIRDVNYLIEKNPLPNGERTKAKDWYKMRGTATVTNGTETFSNCEIHWYQCANIGKVMFKIKVWGDRI